MRTYSLVRFRRLARPGETSPRVSGEIRPNVNLLDRITSLYRGMSPRPRLSAGRSGPGRGGRTARPAWRRRRPSLSTRHGGQASDHPAPLEQAAAMLHR